MVQVDLQGVSLQVLDHICGLALSVNYFDRALPPGLQFCLGAQGRRLQDPHLGPHKEGTFFLPGGIKLPVPLDMNVLEVLGNGLIYEVHMLQKIMSIWALMIIGPWQAL